MSNAHRVTGTSSSGTDHLGSTQSRSKKIGWLALVFAIFSAVINWISLSVGPAAGRASAERGDYENVYTTLIALWIIMIIFAVVAIALGVKGARRANGKVLSGAAIGIGATGVLGLIFHIIQTGLITLLF